MYPDESVPVSFPGLHLSLWLHRVAFHIGTYPIHWYGILIALGLVLALLYASRRVKDFHITLDDLTDVVLWGVVFGIVGARLYYVLFYGTTSGYFWQNPLKIFAIWDGGLAIYGGVIGAFASALVVCRLKKINPLPFFDIAGLGFLIGQGIGRWGNFVNREAFGAKTSLPWRMVVDSSGIGYHPCFLYESLWCALGFVLLHFYSKRRKFNGELFLMYVAWYSFGRFFIEALRTDSLMLGPIRVSQLLAALLFVASAVTLVVVYSKLRTKQEEDAKEYVPLYADSLSAVEESGKEEETEGEQEPADSASEETPEPPENDGDGAHTDEKTEEN